jgi:23S rRNA pseudouridine1911/1915/1917 synthase
VVVEAAREARPGTRILAEQDGLYAAWKPPGLPTEPDRSGTASVVHAVAELLGVPPGELHAATRLDVSVSGIVVLGRGPEGARRAAALKAAGRLVRRYVAITARAPEPAAGRWDAPIGRGRRGEPSVGGRDARPANTKYALIASASPLASGVSPALIVARPVTGRTHQIRLHAAGAGAPLLGDVQHGGPRRVILPDGRAVTADRVALHAGRVDVFDPHAPAWSVTAPFPPDLEALWRSLGGDPLAPIRALEQDFPAAARK